MLKRQEWKKQRREEKKRKIKWSLYWLWVILFSWAMLSIIDIFWEENWVGYLLLWWWPNLGVSLDSRIYNSTLAKNSSLTQLSCPPSPIISLIKALLIFVCIYWINMEGISTLWEFSKRLCMMMNLSVSFPFEWECSTKCKHMVRFWQFTRALKCVDEMY